MRDSSERTWWQATRQRAAAIVGAAMALALLALAVDGDAGPRLFGQPAGAFFAIVVLPLAILIAAFVFTARQKALDRRHDVAED